MKRICVVFLVAGWTLLGLPACPSDSESPVADANSADPGAETTVPDAGTDLPRSPDGASDAAVDIPPPPPACPCVHGACTEGDATSCECYAGWQGEFCEELGDIVVPWDDDGPYGTGIRDRVADITLPLIDRGDAMLSSLWTGEDSFLFALKYGSSSYGAAIWGSNVASLFLYAPDNVHIVFGSYDATWSADMTAMRQRVDSALDALPAAEQERWQGRIHYLNAQANALPGALGQFVSQHAPFLFAIDRLQRWREVGLIWDLVDDSRPIGFIGNESVYFNFEAELKWTLDGLERDLATVVPVWQEGDRHNGGWGGGYSSRWDVEFPDAETMKSFDSMALWLYTACPDHKQGKDAGCNEWDYIQNLFICDQPIEPAQSPEPKSCSPDTGDGAETTTCDCINPLGETVEGQRTCLEDGSDFGPCNCGCGTEFVRYVTSYGREGEWLTDISQLLPMVQRGGKQVLRLAGANGYDLTGNVYLWNSGSGRRPVKLQYLWGRSGGTSFNLDYNAPDTHPPVTFDVPAGTSRVELLATITGHGHSSTVNNCAEFCNHQHEFTINGTSFFRDHPTAGTAYGCLERTHEGGVPNQFGTWQLGRAGWCAGMDVKPFVQAITPMVSATDNVLSYRGLLNYQDYEPVPSGGGDYFPEIKMTSWLVFYEPM